MSMIASALRKTALLAPAALALATAGCADENESGTLTINYRLGAGGQSCADAGVNTVRVSLNGQQFAEDPCDDSGSISLPSVPARNYNELRVEGIDAEGTTILDNAARPEDEQRVEVVGGASVEKDVTLTLTPATVRFIFDLTDENGLAYLGSEMPPIAEFRTEAFRNGGNQLLLTHDFVVAQLDSAIADMPDPNQQLSGDLLDFITVTAIDQGGSSLETLTVSFDPPGPGRLVEVRVECLATMCTATEQIMGGEIDPTGGDTDTGGATTG